MRLEGTVLDASGRIPVAAVLVEATQARDALPGTGWEATIEDVTDPGGRFALEGLRRGPVLLRLTPPLDAPGDREELTADAGSGDLTIRLPPPAVVQFDVVDADDDDAPVFAPVEILRSAPGEVDGVLRYEILPGDGGTPPGIPFPAGPWSVTVTALGYSVAGPLDLDLSRGERRRVSIALHRAPGSVGFVRLRFRDPDGRAIPARRVAFCDVESDALARVVPDGDALLAIAGPGPLVLRPAADPSRQDPDAPWVPAEARAEVTPGKTVEVAVTLEAGGWVRLRDRGDPAPAFFLGGGKVRTQEWAPGDDAGGETWIAGPVPPGRWSVSFPDESHPDAEVEVRVGEVVDLVPDGGGDARPGGDPAAAAG